MNIDRLRKALIKDILKFTIMTNKKILISGPAGSGKTTLAMHFAELFKPEEVLIMNANSYGRVFQNIARYAKFKTKLIILEAVSNSELLKSLLTMESIKIKTPSFGLSDNYPTIIFIYQCDSTDKLPERHTEGLYMIHNGKHFTHEAAN